MKVKKKVMRMYSDEILSFIYLLTNNSIKIWLQDGKIELFVPSGLSFTEEHSNFIKQNRSKIISYLNDNAVFSKEYDFLILRSNVNKSVLSFAQERLWFIEKYEQGTNAYNMPMVFCLSNDFKIDILEKSIKSIVARHEILRSLIKEDNSGNGYQEVVDKGHNLEIEKIKVTDLSQFHQELENSINYVFNLNSELPLKISLYTLFSVNQSTKHYLSIVVHHIVFDGWSTEIFLKELQAYYSSYLELSKGLKNSLNLPYLPIQYKDFAFWQQSYLNGNKFEKQLDYWYTKLVGYEELNLLIDKPRPQFFDYKGNNIYFELDKDTSISLRDLAREFGVSLYSLLLGAYFLMLKHYSNQNDIVLGIPIANRHYSQIEHLIGCFVNSLALRVTINFNESVKDFIQRISQQVIEAQSYQDVPYEKIVEKLKVAKDPSKHPIFQVMFGLQSFEGGTLNYNSTELNHKESKLLKPYIDGNNLFNIAKFDLCTFIDDSETILRASFNYSTSLYSEQTIVDFIETYKLILGRLAELLHNDHLQQHTTLGDLPYLTLSQYEYIIKTSNNNETEYFCDKTIHQLFEDQVERTPNNIAIVSDDNQITYLELNEKSNQLALLLIDAGVKKHDIVGVYQERSSDTIASLLAILKIGASYVPIDTLSPYKRTISSLQPLTNLTCIIATANYNGIIQQLQWELPVIKTVIYIDAQDELIPMEKVDQPEVAEFWDYIANSATDEVTAAGFFSIYTGKPFAKSEVNQYVEHVIRLIGSELNKEKTVLEIGCGSGLIMQSISNSVSHYTGIDPSAETQKRNKIYLEKSKISNVTLVTAFAHEFKKFADKYDLILFASTIQFFPDYNYLTAVLTEAINHLNPNGKIVIVDILDFRKRHLLYQSLLEKNVDTQQATKAITGLYIDESYFNFANLHLTTSIIHQREQFHNELRFRYDVIIQKNNNKDPIKSLVNKQYALPYTCWHVKQYPKNNPNVQITPNYLAYIIFTSGSTGTPKGVKIIHKSAVNLINWVNKTFSITEKDRLLFVTSFTFDLSVYDVFGILSVGASIYLVKQNDVRNITYIADKIYKDGITFWDSAPLMLNQIAGLLLEKKEICSSLRLVFLSGDWIPVTLPVQLKALFPSVQVVSLGGATEATIWSNYYLIDKVEPNWQKIPYGKPIQNTKYYILDDNLKPCPYGVAGQIAISGICLAEDYIGASEKDNNKFLPNHLISVSKPNNYSKLYLTGDLGRYLPDGNIELIGRIDNQVKIRGYRVELGEIENALSNYEGIKQSTVLIHTNQGESETKYLIAYYVADKKIDVEKLHQFLQSRLPDYMLPKHFVFLKIMPQNVSGKLDRNKLLEYKPETIGYSNSYSPPIDKYEKQIAEVWSKLLGIEKIGIHNNFFDLGGHSMLLVKMIAALPSNLKEKITMMDVFKYPTINSLGEFIKNKKSDNNDVRGEEEIKKPQIKFGNRDVAVIGMAGRFPEAENIEEFWENLKSSKECITFFSKDELEEAGVDAELLENSNYVRAQGRLKDIKGFDAKFFNYTPREAKIMDPQQRILLECSWQALEDAGYDPKEYEGDIGVFCGAGLPIYWIDHILPTMAPNDYVSKFQSIIHNSVDFVSSRVAYKLDLTGPAITTQTACSTSLVAIHQACESLILQNCNIALAGGISLGSLEKHGYLYQEGMIMSPDGKCRAFDANAQGTIFGQGVGIVVLKLLEEAIRDGDHIYAVIKSSAINNDGKNKIGFTAPSARGQARVVKAAYEKAGITPNSITYIETHGTGTILGDPIEIEGLTTAFRCVTDEKQFCAIGSLKTNIGHLDAAAGVASLIKTVLCLYNNTLVPSLHFKNANPQLNLSESPFYVNTELKAWESGNRLKRAGVSSFGIGGTNAHIILEEAPGYSLPSMGQHNSWQLITLSANSLKSLDNQIINLANHLRKNLQINLEQVSYTLHTGRHKFKYRSTILAKTVNEAINALVEPKIAIESLKNRPVIFMFPGQGSQYKNMGKELYETVNCFKENIDKCLLISKKYLSNGIEILDILAQTDKINETHITQPALFILEYSLAQYYINLGVNPVAMIGHSIGEYVAACLADVISLEEALYIVIARGRLIQSLPQDGKMLAISLSAEEISDYLMKYADLDVAVINSQDVSIIAGPMKSIEKLYKELQENEVNCNYLRTSHAFHSSLLEPIIPEFYAELTKIKFNKPTIPYISNLTGQWIDHDQVTTPQYWVDHLRHTVLFAQGLDSLFKSEGLENSALLELGPNQVLTKYAKLHKGKNETNIVFASMKRHEDLKQEDSQVLLNTIGRLYDVGVNFNWKQLYKGRKIRKISLPSYPFEREKYWISAREAN